MRSVHSVLVAVHRVRPPASVQLRPQEQGPGYLHAESGAPQLRRQPRHLLPLLHQALSQSQVTCII